MIKKSAQIALVTLSVLTLSACGASGPDAPTRNIKQVTDGVEGQSGQILIRDLLLVAQPDGSAVIIGTFLNHGQSADALTGITVNNIPAKLSAASLPLALNTPVIFSGDSANASGRVPGLNIPVGSRVDITVNFQSAPPITLSAIVRAQTEYFKNVK
jgi:hypothetical protein